RVDKSNRTYDLYLMKGDMHNEIYVKAKSHPFKATDRGFYGRHNHDDTQYKYGELNVQRSGSCAYYSLSHYLRFLTANTTVWEDEFVSVCKPTAWQYYAAHMDEIHAELMKQGKIT